MHGESKRIIKLVEDLLFLTKLDRTPALQLSLVNLSETVKEMESQLRVLAGERRVQFEIADEALGWFESNKIKQVVLNLFNNAVQHTHPDTGRIILSLSASSRQAILSIKDNGPGISDESLPFIFDRFYRADESRNRQQGGAGLGLSITKSIVEAHQGRIEVDSEIDKGTAFRVFLPLL